MIPPVNPEIIPTNTPIFGKEDLEAELEKESTISYKKSKLYLTDKYVVYGYQGLHVEEYDNISWVYIEKRKQNGVTVGKFLIIVTNAGKKKRIKERKTNKGN